MNRILLSATAVAALLLSNGAMAQDSGSGGSNTIIPPVQGGDADGGAGSTGGADAGGGTTGGADAGAGTTGGADAGTGTTGGADAGAGTTGGADAGTGGAAQGETTQGGTAGDAPTTDTQGEGADQSQGNDANQDQGTDANQDQGTDANQEQNTDANQEQNTDVDQEQNTDVNQEQNTEVNVEQNVEITTEQRTVIRDRIIEGGDYEPIVDIDFDISIGVSVPRTIRYYPLAPTLIEILPAAWHSYVFFVLADGRIVILDPDAFAIVYIIEV